MNIFFNQRLRRNKNECRCGMVSLVCLYFFLRSRCASLKIAEKKKMQKWVLQTNFFERVNIHTFLNEIQISNIYMVWYLSFFVARSEVLLKKFEDCRNCKYREMARPYGVRKINILEGLILIFFLTKDSVWKNKIQFLILCNWFFRIVFSSEDAKFVIWKTKQQLKKYMKLWSRNYFFWKG